jgi:hypothetical protein
MCSSHPGLSPYHNDYVMCNTYVYYNVFHATLDYIQLDNYPLQGHMSYCQNIVHISVNIHYHKGQPGILKQ